MGVKGLSFRARQDLPAFHPGRCAEVSINGVFLGVLGQIHPSVADNYGLDCPVYSAQLDFLALLANRAPETGYQPLPRFPSVTRDIAVVCDRGVTVAQLEDCITRGAQGLLKQVELFDIYTAAAYPRGKKLRGLQSDPPGPNERRLTSEEADSDVKSILSLLEQELGAVLR